MTSWNLVVKINWYEVLVVNTPLKLPGNSQDMNYFKVWLRFLYYRKRRFNPHNINIVFFWIPFRRSLICKPDSKNQSRLRFLMQKKKKNSWDILGQNFVKYMFVTITLSKNKVPSSFQEFSSCKNSSFCKV